MHPRFRLPAVLATAALVAGSFAGPARAATHHAPPHPAHARPPAQLVVTAPAASVNRTPRTQPTAES